MIKKIIHILLIILFILLPLINSHLIDLFWIKWWFYVDWNYEFSKVIFFNIFSWFIISLFFINSYLKNIKINIPQILLYLIWVLILSNVFSAFFYTSLLWNTSKSHSTIMFLNLIWLFIILNNIDKKILKQLLLSTLFSSILVWIIWIKEYYFPTFDYWNLSNRAISTFGHPNYLALYILILIPLIVKKIRHKLYLTLFILLSVLLFLTKSAWWIFIFFTYLVYKFLLLKNIRKSSKKILLVSFLIFLSIIFLIFILKYYPEKLQSFLSRFYIWKTTLLIIFSDIKNIIFWSWLGSLDYIFNWFKNKELYIYENIGFTADRPHNLILYYFYNFWILWLSFLIYIIYNLKNKYVKLKTKYNNQKLYYESIILFILFTIFNSPSITHYLIIILIITLLNSYNNTTTIKNILLTKIVIALLIINSIFWIYFSISYYSNEYNIKLNKNYITENYLIKKIQSEDYIYNLFKNWIWDIEITCSKMIIYQNSVENNFYCWNILWNYNKDLAKQYYNNWLKKLPNMWNDDSIYYNNYLIKQLFISNRFYSEKFSNLEEILKRVWIKR